MRPYRRRGFGNDRRSVEAERVTQGRQQPKPPGPLLMDTSNVRRAPGDRQISSRDSTFATLTKLLFNCRNRSGLLEICESTGDEISDELALILSYEKIGQSPLERQNLPIRRLFWL
jgi:hypothetical protein